MHVDVRNIQEKQIGFLYPYFCGLLCISNTGQLWKGVYVTHDTGILYCPGISPEQRLATQRLHLSRVYGYAVYYMTVNTSYESDMVSVKQLEHNYTTIGNLVTAVSHRDTLHIHTTKIYSNKKLLTK